MADCTDVAMTVEVEKIPRYRGNTKVTDDVKARIIELLTKDVPQEEIAALLDISQRTVSRVKQDFAKVFRALPRVADYRNTKSDLLAAGQLAALESAFSGKKLDKAGFLSTLQGFEILNKAERLETGQSTEISEHRVFGAIVTGHLSDSQVLDNTREVIDVTPDNGPRSVE